MIDAILPRARSKALFALVSLAFLIGLILTGLADQKTPTAYHTRATGVYTDISLYRTIAAEMRRGAGYYGSAVSEARKHGYPLRPFVTVRLPTLAWFLSALPSDKTAWGALMALAFVALCAWAKKLRADLTKPQYALAMICITSGLFPVLVPDFALFHETWAGLLVALSLAIRRKDAWVASVLIGLAAALTRELAGAYLLAMAAMALKDRNAREAAAWLTAITVFAIVLAIHAANVNALVTPADISSSGWIVFGGWSFVLHVAQCNVFLALLPPWMIAIVVPLALLGLTTSQIDQRLSLVVYGYFVAFLLVGRTDNIYWGLLIAPLWSLGLAFAIQTMREHLSDIQPIFRLMTQTPQRPTRMITVGAHTTLAVLVGIVVLVVLF